MYDLDLILFFNRGLRPCRAAHDFAVTFDCEAFGRKREMTYQSFDSELIGNFARLAVDDDVQNLLTRFP